MYKAVVRSLLTLLILSSCAQHSPEISEEQGVISVYQTGGGLMRYRRSYFVTDDDYVRLRTEDLNAQTETEEFALYPGTFQRLTAIMEENNFDKLNELCSDERDVGGVADIGNLHISQKNNSVRTVSRMRCGNFGYKSTTLFDETWEEIYQAVIDEVMSGIAAK